jgi:hypothetical protein
LKGCRRNERKPFLSGAVFSLVDGNLVDGDGCDAAAPVLATCEAELLELWLLAELADELEPPESLLCEAPELDDPLKLAEPPELDPPVPEERCARRVAETNRIAATTRPESRIKHLPTD